MPLDPVSLGDPHVSAHNAERDAIEALEQALPTKMPLPNNPAVGSMLRFNGTNWVPSKMKLYEGEGSPEGVVAAPVGSRYVDALATGGVAEWFKQHGVGDNDNTGWSPLSVDTGWLTVTPGPGFGHVTGKQAQVRVINGLAYHRGAIKRNTGTGTQAAILPEGTWPGVGVSTMIRARNDWVPWIISTTGSIAVSSVIDNGDEINIGSAAGIPYFVAE